MPKQLQGHLAAFSKMGAPSCTSAFRPFPSNSHLGNVVPSSRLDQKSNIFVSDFAQDKCEKCQEERGEPLACSSYSNCTLPGLIQFCLEPVKKTQAAELIHSSLSYSAQLAMQLLTLPQQLQQSTHWWGNTNSVVQQLPHTGGAGGYSHSSSPFMYLHASCSPSAYVCGSKTVDSFKSLSMYISRVQKSANKKKVKQS